MTALNLSTFAPEVVLLGATTIVGPSAAVSSVAVTGFSDVASATIVVKVERVDNSNGEALSVTVQQSDDGNSWTTAAGPYSFTREGTQTLAIEAPADRLRVTYAAARGVREATIGSVTARVGVVDAPGEVLSATVSLTNAQILAMNTGGSSYAPVTVVPATSGVLYALTGASWQSNIVDDYTTTPYLVVASSAGIPTAEWILDQLYIEVGTPPRYKPVAVTSWDLTPDLVVGSGEITGGGNAANTATVTVYYSVITLA